MHDGKVLIGGDDTQAETTTTTTSTIESKDTRRRYDFSDDETRTWKYPWTPERVVVDDDGCWSTN